MQVNERKQSKNLSDLSNSTVYVQAFPPNFVVPNFSVNGQFPYLFGEIVQKSAENAHLRTISFSGNYVEKFVFCTV